MSDPGEITAILAQIEVGDRQAVDRLLPLLYDELYAMADRRMKAERKGHTLGATALVHEAYLKLVIQDRVDWKNRAHFLSVAAIAMRRILVNHAEAKRAQKRGAGEVMVTFDDAVAKNDVDPDELIALHRALDELAKLDARQAKVIEYSFFGGLTHEEIAEVLSVSVPTVRRDYRIAKAWLARRLNDR
jgi:RNA polymerase sigma factor (TIGR02999 family)